MIDLNEKTKDINFQEKAGDNVCDSGLFLLIKDTHKNEISN